MVPLSLGKVPFAEHTSDKYVLLANQRLVEEGYDVEGLHFTQPAFQVGSRGQTMRPTSAPGTPVSRGYSRLR